MAMEGAVPPRWSLNFEASLSAADDDDDKMLVISSSVTKV